ncbi:MAG: hypothetical protein WHX52_14515 [Anaerolineae bacterium]
MLDSIEGYAQFVYALPARYPIIQKNTLAISFPHHQHVPPDIKYHRIPAPHLSFTAPNLPALIEEIKQRFFS